MGKNVIVNHRHMPSAESPRYQRWLHRMTKPLVIMLVTIIVGWLAMIVAYALPNGPVRAHVTSSAEIIETQGAFPQLVGGRAANAIPDNNTDAWMLLMAEYDGPHTIIEKSLGNYYVQRGITDAGIPGYDSLIANTRAQLDPNGEDATKPTQTASYARYWHGYMLPLRLLLEVCDYSNIRILLIAAVVAIIAAISYTLARRGLAAFAVAFVGLHTLMLPVTPMLSMQFATVWFIAMISMLLMLRHPSIRTGRLGYPCFFMLVGATTSYMDLLSYPLFSFGICAVTAYVLSHATAQTASITYVDGPDKQRSSDQPIGPGHIIGYAAAWAAGYGVMWAAKWVIGAAVLGRTVITDALHQVAVRTSGSAQQPGEAGTTTVSYWGTLARNISPYAMPAHVLLVLLVLLVLAVMIIRKGRRSGSTTVTRMFRSANPLPMAMVALAPFIWLALTENHSYIHRNFVCSILAISGFAIFGYLAVLADTVDTTQPRVPDTSGNA